MNNESNVNMKMVELPVVAGCFIIGLGIHSHSSVEMNILKISLLVNFDILYLHATTH